MIAAIYARKSTEQERGESGDSLSVEEQVAGAKGFIEGRDWKLGPIFKDEAVSGWTVPLEERPGGKALLDAVRAKKINVLVMRNESRLGREMADALTSLVTLTRAGVRVFYYSTGQEVTLRTAKDKLVASIGHFGAEDYAERVSADTRRGKLKKAREGHWQGPRVYGYQKHEVRGPKGERLYVDLKIDDAEAAVVRRIFDLIARGHGLHRIAKGLGAEGVPSPRGKGWAVTSLRYMIDNVLYKGVVRYEGRKDDGSVEVVEVEKPEWRIVDDAAWKAAHDRIERTRRLHPGHRKADGTLQGRPESVLVSRHLLAGHLRCGVCGGGMFVAPRKAQVYYLCTNYWKQGTKRCTNRYSLPYDAVTAAVLSHFKPEALREALQRVYMEQLNREPVEPSNADQRAGLEVEARKLEQEIGNLVNAVAVGGDIPALVARLKEAQRQHEDLATRLEHLDSDEQGFEITDEEAWEEWQAQVLEQTQEALQPLDADPVTGRQVLRDLLTQPITIMPVVDEQGRVAGWDYLGLGALDRVLSGKILQGGGKVVPSNRPQIL